MTARQKTFWLAAGFGLLFTGRLALAETAQKPPTREMPETVIGDLITTLGKMRMEGQSAVRVGRERRKIIKDMKALKAQLAARRPEQDPRKEMMAELAAVRDTENAMFGAINLLPDANDPLFDPLSTAQERLEKDEDQLMADVIDLASEGLAQAAQGLLNVMVDQTRELVKEAPMSASQKADLNAEIDDDKASLEAGLNGK